MKHSAAESIHLYLTLEQSSLLLEALIEQPFKTVFEIIGSLNLQAQQFYQAPSDQQQPQLIILNNADFSLCIRALGELPYNRVSGLIHYLHQQLSTQLVNAAELSADNTATGTRA